MQPKYLKNSKTGAIFPFHKGLLRNKNMEPYDGDPKAKATDEEIADEVIESQPQSNQFSVSRASKQQLLDYAANEYGVQLEDSLTVKELREQVKNLQEEM